MIPPKTESPRRRTQCLYGQIEIKERTGTSETNGGDGARFGVDDEELERKIRSVGSKETIERPLQCVSALLAIVHSDDHHRLLISCSHDSQLFSGADLSALRKRVRRFQSVAEKEGSVSNSCLSIY